MRSQYFLVLVANAESKNPAIQLIQDPATKIDEGNEFNADLVSAGVGFEGRGRRSND
jgi:hypothetical protein